MLTLTDILELKKQFAKEFGTELHYHDVCPKPYFTLDDSYQEIKSFLTEALAKKNYRPAFSAEGTQFTVERG